MKHILITTIAAVLLVGCGESQQSAKDIWEAAKQGDVDAVKQFIVDGEDVNAKDHRGSTPLLKAAYKGHKEVAELLIAEGADVNAKDDARITPLHPAANHNHKEVAELLIGKGADVNAKAWGDATPLDWADGETADLLRKHGGKTGEELEAEEK